MGKNKERPVISGSGFDALKGFKPSTPKKEMPKTEIVANLTEEQKPKEAKKSEVRYSDGGPTVIGEYDDTPRYDSSALMRPEDQLLFQELIQPLDLNNKKRETISGKIYRAIMATHYADANWDLQFLSHSNNARVEEIYQLLLKRGIKMQAVGYILSLRLEPMKFGPKNQSPQEKRIARLKEAEKAAKRIGLTVEQIAEEFGLTYLLNG